MSHNIKHHLICFIHPLRSNPRQIADTLINIFINNSFYRSYAAILHSHYSGQHSCLHSCRHLQGTARFRTVTYHSGQVGYHVLNCKSHLLITASHQPSDSTTGTGSSYHTTAKCRKTSQTLLNIYHSQMTHHQRTDQFLLRFSVFFGINHYRQCSGNTLITTTRVTHNRNHRSCHACITSSRCIRKNM